MTLALAVWRPPALAQEADGTRAEVLVITGSHIKRDSFAVPASIQVLDAQDIALQGVNTVSDLLVRLTANVGSEFNANAFTQNATFGTSQVNLRGLGLGSTLVLLNGRRINLSGIAADDGSSFVDINLIPLAAIERVEILLDGASAIYGSDAVAGVVNFITRSDYEGFEVQADFQKTTDGDQQDRGGHLLFGGSSDRGHFTSTFSYLNRTPLENVERSFTKKRIQMFSGPPGPTQVSALRGLAANGAGQPATYLPVAGGVPSGAPFPDPGCGAPGTNSELDPLFLADFAIGSPNGIPPSCLFDFNPFFELVATEERINIYNTAEYDFSDSLHFAGDFTFARNTARRTISPSFEMVTEFPVVPSAHPDNVFGSDLLMIGRPLGANAGAEVNRNRTDHYRAAGSLDGDAGALLSGLGSWLTQAEGDALAEKWLVDEWEWEASAVWSLSDQLFRANDTARDPFLRALNGCGGPEGILATAGSGTPGPAGCDTSAANYFSPATTYNPFSSAYLGGGTPNSQQVIDSFIAQVTNNVTSELITFDGVFRGPLPWQLWAEEPISMAIGGHGRRERLDSDFDDISNEDGFLFSLGAPDSSAERWTAAFYAEGLLPVDRGIDLAPALRWESVAGVGDRASPQIRGRLLPFDNRWVSGPEWLRRLWLNASFNTSFRAPSLVQTSSFQTRLEEISDPLGGPPTFRPVRTQGDPDLEPETSENWSAGFDWRPVDSLSLGFTWWSYDLEDLIIQPSAQGFVNSNPLQLCGSPAIPPCLQRDPVSGAIQIVLLEFQNASVVETNGLDLNLDYSWTLGDWGWGSAVDFGLFHFGARSTFMNKYEIRGFGGLNAFDAAGSRNFQNFARSLPEWRANFIFDWALGNHSASAVIHFTAGYTDDEDFNNDGVNCQAPNGGIDALGAVVAPASPQCFREVSAYTTLDLQYSYRWERIGDGTVLTLGLLNVTDADPPFVQTNAGYDATLGDPRGRMFYVKLKQAW